MPGNCGIHPHTAFRLVLRKLRKSARLSQEQLGLESGVQRNFISLVETGQNQPTITTIFKLTGALNVKASKIVSETVKLIDQGP